MFAYSKIYQTKTINDIFDEILLNNVIASDKDANIAKINTVSKKLNVLTNETIKEKKDDAELEYMLSAMEFGMEYR